MRFGTCCQCTKVGQTSRSVRMGLQPTNRYENPAVGQALGLRRPLRPPGRAFHNLQWVFDRARVLQDPLFVQRNSRTGRRGPAAGLESCPTHTYLTSPQEYVILPSIDDGKAGRTRNSARNAGSANPANPGPRTDARLRHRAAAQAGFRRRAPGGREFALPRPATSAAQWLGQSGVGRIREQPARTLLYLDRRGPEATRLGAREIRPRRGRNLKKSSTWHEPGRSHTGSSLAGGARSSTTIWRRNQYHDSGGGVPGY